MLPSTIRTAQQGSRRCGGSRYILGSSASTSKSSWRARLGRNVVVKSATARATRAESGARQAETMRRDTSPRGDGASTDSQATPFETFASQRPPRQAAFTFDAQALARRPSARASSGVAR